MHARMLFGLGATLAFVGSPAEATTSAPTPSTLRNNPKGEFETPGFPGMFIIAAPGNPQVSNSTIE